MKILAKTISMLAFVLLTLTFSCKKVDFSDEFVAANKNKVTSEVPEVSELVNIAIALALDDANSDDTLFVYQRGAYYNEMLAHFGKYKNETIVKQLEEKIRFNYIFYPIVRTEAYCFEFDSKGKIVRKKNFKSMGIPVHNLILTNQDELQAFADKTNFRDFYAKHKSVYDEQNKYYLETANVPKMQTWLQANYPDAKVNSVGIILSPLCYTSQNTITGINDNGLFPAYLFINYPYLEGNITNPKDIRRGALAFTELNHNYENQEAEKSIYRSRIEKVFADDKWTTSDARKFYKNINAFEEYVNWSLTSLWYYDNEPDTTLANKYIARNEEHQVKNRGLLKFKEFDQFLLNRYKNRKPNETIASFYPEIMDWIEKQ